jgi:putative FmdB family regulatory protein
MPIYEFYCRACHMIFSFYAGSVNTTKKPRCPKCGKPKLERQLSVFATPRNRGEEGDGAPLPDLDENKMEKAMQLLSKEADHMDENDPKQAANLMRQLSDMTGLNLGPGMEEALRRMEAGEDPEQVEAEMGDLLEEEEPFILKNGPAKAARTRPPAKDEQLHFL